MRFHGGSLLARLRAAHAAQVELRQRMWLLRQPWLEDLMHWSYDDGRWRLHGHVLPPGGRVRSLTRDGWCPGARGRRAPTASRGQPEAR